MRTLRPFWRNLLSCWRTTIMYCRGTQPISWLSKYSEAEMFTKGKKTALVTGASSGMGKSIAKRLIKDGYQVYVAARSVDKMADLANPVLSHCASTSRRTKRSLRASKPFWPRPAASMFWSTMPDSAFMDRWKKSRWMRPVTSSRSTCSAPRA